MSDAAPVRRRVFFAFWPDESTRAAAEASRSRLFPLAGRPVTPDDLHVTAAFIGGLDSSRLEPLARLAGAVPPFELQLDALEHWPKPRVLVATARSPCPQALETVSSLWQRLQRLGIPRETRPWRAHVTLARDVTSIRPGLVWAAVRWPVRRLALVESLPSGAAGTENGRYRLLS